MSHDFACDFLTPTMQFLEVGYVCILVSVEGERSGKAAKKKHRERTPDESGSDEEPLQKILERRVDDEERSLQAYKNEALRKKSAQMKTGAGSSGSSLLSEQTINKKPAAIVSPNKRKLSTDDPENG